MPFTIRSTSSSSRWLRRCVGRKAQPTWRCLLPLRRGDEFYAKYRDRGLVVVGVHTPEFPFERSASNVQAALKRHGITYPVAQDNDSRTWNAYRNQYWPAQYIVDQSGKIVFQHDGEGQYDVPSHACSTPQAERIREPERDQQRWNPVLRPIAL
jgi:hypothetical protein